jgi:hypothetical protein
MVDREELRQIMNRAEKLKVVAASYSATREKGEEIDDQIQRVWLTIALLETEIGLLQTLSSLARDAIEDARADACVEIDNTGGAL